jgi:hypothetical protein
VSHGAARDKNRALKCAKRGRFAYFALKLPLMGQISELPGSPSVHRSQIEEERIHSVSAWV